MQFSVKLVDAQFPPYQQVIPQSAASTRQRAARRSADALKAVSRRRERPHRRREALAASNGSMRITSESPESGDGFDELPVDYAGPSSPSASTRSTSSTCSRDRRRRGRARPLRRARSRGACSPATHSAADDGVPRRRHADAHLTSARELAHRARACTSRSSAIVPQPADIDARARASTSIAGDNGQGKTNLLEALYVAAHVEELSHVIACKSCVAHGAEFASVDARALRSESRRRAQRVDVSDAGRAARAHRRQARRAARRVCRANAGRRLSSRRARRSRWAARRAPAICSIGSALFTRRGDRRDRRRYTPRAERAADGARDARRAGRPISRRRRRSSRAHGAPSWRIAARRPPSSGAGRRAGFRRIGRRRARASRCATRRVAAATRTQASARSSRARRAADLAGGTRQLRPARDDLALVIDGRPARSRLAGAAPA